MYVLDELACLRIWLECTASCTRILVLQVLRIPYDTARELFLFGRPSTLLCFSTTCTLHADSIIHFRVRCTRVSTCAAVRADETQRPLSDELKTAALASSKSPSKHTQRKTRSPALRCRSISHSQERAALPKSSLLRHHSQPCLPSQRDGDSWRLDSL